MSAPVLHRIASRIAERVNMPDVVFFCPGCKCEHGVWTSKAASNGARWTWNEDMVKPTFSPSLLITFETTPKQVCHSFVRDGHIQFLGDSTHALAGQTVALPPQC
jgi:hypothetical protein